MNSELLRRVGLTYRYDYKAEVYVRALRRFGLEPVLMNPRQSALPLSQVKGLVLSGGADVNPARYGQRPHPKTSPPDDERDRFEADLLMRAIQWDIPVLCICRGMQLLNTEFGGSLHQHIEHHEIRGGDPSNPVHDVVLEADTILAGVFGRARVPVNSRHHQAVDRLGAGLVVSAVAEDQTVEAVECRESRFVVGVQWHPEDQVSRSATQGLLFSRYAGAVIGG